jgi:hypothetical protein
MHAVAYNTDGAAIAPASDLCYTACLRKCEARHAGHPERDVHGARNLRGVPAMCAGVAAAHEHPTAGQDAIVVGAVWNG